MASKTFLVPGQPLRPGPTSSQHAFTLPSGTYLHRGYIYSSRLSTSSPPAVPSLSAIVYGRVLRVSPKQASISIIATESHPLLDPCIGILRSTDVRQTMKDAVIMYDMFRPGDIVKAQVVSLGDQKSYYVSTARNDLGVVLGRGRHGGDLVPVDWEHMRNVETGEVEKRKVAKPDVLDNEENLAEMQE